MNTCSSNAYQVTYFLFYVSGLIYTGYNISINVRSYLNQGFYTETAFI